MQVLPEFDNTYASCVVILAKSPVYEFSVNRGTYLLGQKQSQKMIADEHCVGESTFFLFAQFN